VSQQPYQQPGQPGGYQQPGQSGYPQGGYPQPGQQPQQQYGGYQGSGSGYPSPSSSSAGNPLATAGGLAPILQILAYVVAGLAVLGAILAFTIDGYPGTLKFFYFCTSLVTGLGLAGILLALSVGLKSRSQG
jgi:hypothetical protein